MSEHMLRDVHPAEVFWPAKSERPIPARVFVTTTRVVVYVEQDGMVACWGDTPITGERPEPNRGSLFGQIHLDTNDGPMHISKGRGCGCHSALKAVVPPATW